MRMEFASGATSGTMYENKDRPLLQGHGARPLGASISQYCWVPCTPKTSLMPT